LQWDPQELLSLVDFADKTGIDVGNGTGKLALIAAEKAEAVYAAEPNATLREYLKDKARQQGFWNVYTMDGLITDLPFSGRFADEQWGVMYWGSSRRQSIKRCCG
jgi:predicted RNA methylase